MNSNKSTKQKLYAIWCTMHRRVYNINDKDYKYYGAKGVIVCNEWHNAETFIKELKDSYVPGLTLDRIDGDKDYCFDNCRWATRTTQSCNTRIIMSTNTSGYRGVSYDKSKNKWRSQINVNKKLDSRYLTQVHIPSA